MRYKRDIVKEYSDELSNSSLGVISTPSQTNQTIGRQRKIKKFIRKLPQNNIRYRNHSDILDKANTQTDNTHNFKSETYSRLTTLTLNPTKRRIIVPIRRTKLRAAQSKPHSMNPTSVQPSKTVEEIPLDNISPVVRTLVYSTKIRSNVINDATQNPIQLEPSHTDIDIESNFFGRISTHLLVETITQLAIKPRTYTFIVTRVHDHQTEVISSTEVRDQMKTITTVLTRTSLETIAVPSTTVTSPTNKSDYTT